MIRGKMILKGFHARGDSVGSCQRCTADSVQCAGTAIACSRKLGIWVHVCVQVDQSHILKKDAGRTAGAGGHVIVEIAHDNDFMGVLHEGTDELFEVGSEPVPRGVMLIRVGRGRNNAGLLGVDCLGASG